MIARKPHSLQRFIEIIRSMRKPQISYQIEVDPFSNPYTQLHRINILAVNEGGICEYSGTYIIEDEDNKYVHFLRSMHGIFFKPIDTFITHDRSCK